LEKERQEKRIGKALEAKAEIVAPVAQLNHGDEDLLRELVNVSSLKISAGDADSFSVSKADGQKCERCWHWEMDIGQNATHPTICGRCVKAVLEFKP
jgi:isoleucyl-tRNA synthetase